MSEGRPTLTYALRNLVWSVQSEVDVITSLSRQIDARVTALNAARTDVAARLARLDALVASTDDPHLSAFLRERVVVALPVEDEVIPPRLDRP